MRNDSFDSEAMSGESGDDEVETKNQTDREKGKMSAMKMKKNPKFKIWI